MAAGRLAFGNDKTPQVENGQKTCGVLFCVSRQKTKLRGIAATGFLGIGGEPCGVRLRYRILVARGFHDNSLCGGPASSCRLLDSLQGPGSPFPTRGRWVAGGAVTRYKAFKLLRR